MTDEEKRKEAAAWLDQLETSVTRAEQAKKDLDLICLLRWAYKKAREDLRNEQKRTGEI